MGSKLFFKDGEKIQKGKKIAEWDPYTLPVIAETSGILLSLVHQLEECVKFATDEI